MAGEWEISEFVTYDLEELNEKFRITIEGSSKFKWLLAEKIQNIRITEEDLKDLEE